MKFKHLFLISALAISACGIASCNKGAEKTDEQNDTIQATAMSVDSVLANIEALNGQEVTVKGLCTHICKHGGTKAFLANADTTAMVMCMATDSIGGSFAPDCPNHQLEVVGVVTPIVVTKSQVDARVAAMKEQAAAAGHCNTEQKANGSFEELQERLNAQIAAGGDTTIVYGYYISTTSYSIEQ